MNRDRASEVGCDLVLAKPFDPRQLLAQVKSLIGAPRSEQQGDLRDRGNPPAVTVAPMDPPVPLKADPIENWGPRVSPFFSLGPGASQPETGRAGDGSTSIDDAYDALMRQLSDPTRRASVVALRADDELLVERAVERVLERLDPAAVREAMEDIIANQAKRVIQEEIERIRRP